MCDVNEMYLQVEMKKKDRPRMCRILWRDCNDDHDPGVFKFNCVVLGENATSMNIVQENPRQHENSYLMAAETVLKSTYMDDSIDGMETEEEVIELY